MKMGSESKVLLVQEMHQHIISKDYEEVAEFLHDDITFYLDDGSSMQGKETILSFLKEVYSKMDILDYQVGVNLSRRGSMLTHFM